MHCISISAAFVVDDGSGVSVVGNSFDPFVVGDNFGTFVVSDNSGALVFGKNSGAFVAGTVIVVSFALRSSGVLFPGLYIC